MQPVAMRGPCSPVRTRTHSHWVAWLRYLKRNIFQSLTDFFEHKAARAGEIVALPSAWTFRAASVTWVPSAMMRFSCWNHPTGWARIVLSFAKSCLGEHVDVWKIQPHTRFWVDRCTSLWMSWSDVRWRSFCASIGAVGWDTATFAKWTCPF